MSKIREVLKKHRGICCDCSMRYGEIEACQKCNRIEDEEKEIRKSINKTRKRLIDNLGKEAYKYPRYIYEIIKHTSSVIDEVNKDLFGGC